jgi:signal peptidase I
MGKENIKKNIYRTYPGDSLLGWNILNFGPFYLPRKGDSIPMNRKNYLLYKQAIEWEQGKPLVYRDSSFLIGGRSLLGYRFRESYYFVGGDRVENSQDSRYWGLLPEDYIAGKVVLVWESDAPFTEKFR